MPPEDDGAGAAAVPGVVLFSGDNYGIGHVYRNARVANAVLRHASPNLNVTLLVVTGTASAFLPRLEHGADYLRMPAIIRQPGGIRKPYALRMSFEDVMRLRRSVLAIVVKKFAPRVFYVDHLTSNIRREVEEVLSITRPGATKHRILALDHVLNDPESVIPEWREQGLAAFAGENFDEVWVYGDPEVFDLREAYELPTTMRKKIRYLGHFPALLPAQLTEALRSTGRRRWGCSATDRLVLVTGGGGHDAADLFHAYIRASGHLPDDVVSLLVPGPLFPEDARSELEGLCKLYGGRLILSDYLTSLEDMLPAVDGVVTMGGGSTVMDVLAAGKPALVLPRAQWKSAQKFRADVLGRRGWIRVLMLPDATPELFASEVRALLATTVGTPQVVFNGVNQAASLVLQRVAQ
jgi:predicted glycosyltransferase